MERFLLLPRLSTAGFEFDLSGFWRRLALYNDLARERHALRGLDPRLLRDIGLDTPDAAREADRPFWDVPAGR